MDLLGEDTGCGGPGLARLHVVLRLLRPSGCTANSLKLIWLMVEKVNIQFKGNSSGGHSGSQIIAASLKTRYIRGIVLCDKTAHLEWPFIVASLRHTCGNNHAV